MAPLKSEEQLVEEWEQAEQQWEACRIVYESACRKKREARRLLGEARSTTGRRLRAEALARTQRDHDRRVREAALAMPAGRAIRLDDVAQTAGLTLAEVQATWDRLFPV